MDDLQTIHCPGGGQLRLVNGDTEPDSGPAAQSPPSRPADAAQTSSQAIEQPSATLMLDPTGARRFVIQAPPTVSTKELERIKKWLEVQLIVEEPDTTSNR